MKNLDELKYHNQYHPFGSGTYDYITRNGITYVRFRKMYNSKRKEFIGKNFEEVNESIRAFEKHPQSPAKRSLSKMTLYDYTKQYLEELASERRDESILTASYNKYALQHIGSHKIGKLALNRITSSDIKKYIIELAKEPYCYTKSTINKDYFLIKRSLEHAKRKGIIIENPVDYVAPIREDEVVKKTKKVHPLDTEDIEKLLKEAKRINTKEHQINGKIGTRVYGVNADVVCFLFYTGLRIGECLALKYSDLEKNSLGETVLHVRHSLKRLPNEIGKSSLQRGSTKTQSSVRSFALPDQALAIIEEQKRLNPKATKNDYIFVGETGNPILYRNVNRTLRQMLNRAGCKQTDLSLHGLRHTFGSYLVSNQVNLYTVSKLLGHSSIKITENVYAELLPHRYDEVSNSFNKIKNND